jgi:Asp-tRNA(Asn)/Glu-tRNA(Gln) amidotransferase A subunit family amidase
VEGFPTRAGSPLREDHLARADAPLVAALRKAGAIILGKTVTVEFACFDPSPTRNPWDPALRTPGPTGPAGPAAPPQEFQPTPTAAATAQYTPGGSSSGSAAAVALGMCLGAIGTQTGGSLVRPASYCGVATCKPTFGRIDTEGIVPVSYHLDHPGPMARTVGDLEVMLKPLLAPQKFKSVSRPGTAPRRAPKRSFGHVGRQEWSPPRLGLLEEFFMQEADGPVREVVRSALARLRQGGAMVEPVDCRVDFAEVAPLHRRIMAVEAAAYHREPFAAHRLSYGPLITALLDEGLATSAVDYAAALAHQRRFRRHIDAVLAQYNNNVDALVMPSTDTTAPATLTTTGTPKFQAPWSYAGVPAVSIPCGLAADGMPVGLQLVGRRDREGPLMAAARWCERQVGFAAVPPMWRESLAP